MDREVMVDGHRFGVSQVPGAIDVTLLSGPSAGRGFTMGGPHAHEARIVHACRRFLEAMDQSTGRIDYQ